MPVGLRPVICRNVRPIRLASGKPAGAATSASEAIDSSEIAPGESATITPTEVVVGRRRAAEQAAASKIAGAASEIGTATTTATSTSAAPGFLRGLGAGHSAGHAADRGIGGYRSGRRK